MALSKTAIGVIVAVILLAFAALDARGESGAFGHTMIKTERSI